MFVCYIFFSSGLCILFLYSLKVKGERKKKRSDSCLTQRHLLNSNNWINVNCQSGWKIKLVWICKRKLEQKLLLFSTLSLMQKFRLIFIAGVNLSCCDRGVSVVKLSLRSLKLMLYLLFVSKNPFSWDHQYFKWLPWSWMRHINHPSSYQKKEYWRQKKMN